MRLAKQDSDKLFDVLRTELNYTKEEAWETASGVKAAFEKNTRCPDCEYGLCMGCNVVTFIEPDPGNDTFAESIATINEIREMNQGYAIMKTGFMEMAEKAKNHFMGKSSRNQMLEKVWVAMEEIHLKFSQNRDPSSSSLQAETKATKARLDGIEKKLRTPYQPSALKAETDELKFDPLKYTRHFRKTRSERGMANVNDHAWDMLYGEHC